MVNAWATAIQDWIPEATEDILSHLDEFMYGTMQMSQQVIMQTWTLALTMQMLMDMLTSRVSIK